MKPCPTKKKLEFRLQGIGYGLMVVGLEDQIRNFSLSQAHSNPSIWEAEA
jgi:hypothetical protein